MIGKLLELIASKLSPPRVIYDRAGVSPYLSRWYLLGRPTMPDGSHPFDPDGSPRSGIRDPDRPFAVFLHKFHRGDDDVELHNHPWTWSIALILSGGYREEYRRGAREGGGCVFVRTMGPLSVNVIHHDTFHRVELLEKDAWSLFVAGPREKSWGFWNRATGIFTHWRMFIDRKRDPTAFAQDDARQGRDNTFYANRTSGIAGVVPGSALDRAILRSDSRDHCVGDEPLVEVDVYPCDHVCSAGPACNVCDAYAKRAEAGDLQAHKVLVSTMRDVLG
jgi:hypothetical protein